MQKIWKYWFNTAGMRLNEQYPGRNLRDIQINQPWVWVILLNNRIQIEWLVLIKLDKHTQKLLQYQK